MAALCFPARGVPGTKEVVNNGAGRAEKAEIGLFRKLPRRSASSADSVVRSGHFFGCVPVMLGGGGLRKAADSRLKKLSPAPPAVSTGIICAPAEQRGVIGDSEHPRVRNVDLCRSGSHLHIVALEDGEERLSRPRRRRRNSSLPAVSSRTGLIVRLTGTKVGTGYRPSAIRRIIFLIRSSV